MGSDMPQWVSVSVTAQASHWPRGAGQGQEGCPSEERLSDGLGMLTSRHH